MCKTFAIKLKQAQVEYSESLKKNGFQKSVFQAFKTKVRIPPSPPVVIPKIDGSLVNS